MRANNSSYRDAVGAGSGNESWFSTCLIGKKLNYAHSFWSIHIMTTIKSRKSLLCHGLPVLIAAGVLAPLTSRGAFSVAPRLIAAVDVNIYLGAPPPPRHEVIVERERPSRNHVWVAGYWANHHGRHEWVAGHWELPPHGRTVWIAPRWEKRDRGYVFIDGYWAEPHHDHHDDHHDNHHDHH